MMSTSHFSLTLVLLAAASISPAPALEVPPCDSLVPEYCSLPYPNSYFTVPSQDTPTGVRLNLSADFFPNNTLKVRMDPAKWNSFGK